MAAGSGSGPTNDQKYQEIQNELRDEFNKQYDKKFGDDRENWTKEQRDQYLHEFRGYEDRYYDPENAEGRVTIDDHAQARYKERYGQNYDNSQSTSSSKENYSEPRVRSHYEVIGVDRDASQEDIKKAITEARKEWHPDKHMMKDDQGNVINQIDEQAQEMFKQVQIANKEIGTDEARAAYDRSLAQQERLLAEQMSQQEIRIPQSEYTPSAYPPAPEGTSYIIPSEGPVFTQQGPSLIQQGAGGAAQLASGKIADTAKKKIVNATVKKAGGSAAKKVMTQKVMKKAGEVAAKKAAEMGVAAATGGTSEALMMALRAGKFAMDHAKELIKGAIMLAVAFSTSTVPTFASGLTGWAIMIVTIPLVLATFVIIINTGAYITPQAPDLIVSDIEDYANATVECLNFTGPWPQSALETEKKAANIIAQDPRYVGNLCSGGDIEVEYNPVQAVFRGIQYGGERVAPGKLIIYGKGTGSLGNSLYTLAHELGHEYDARNGLRGSMSRNAAIVAEWPICTYPFQPAPAGESTAEAIALYIAGPSPESGYRNLRCMGGTFMTKYDATWTYLRNNVFSSDGRW